MSNSQIVNVNDTNFQVEVLSFSQNTPVIVEFWAEWCRDCRSFYPLLEKKILNSYPHIRLAKINVDNNPNTTLRYSVRSLPSIKAFSYARVVDHVTGIVPEQRLEEMLTKLITVGQNTLSLEKAINLYQDQQFPAAEKEFNQYLDQNPDATDALFGLAKTELCQQRYDQALNILTDFPASKYNDAAKQMQRFAVLMQQYQTNQLPNQNSLDATFLTALRLVNRKNYEAALDGLLDILKQDKSYGNGDAKTVFLSVLEILPETAINTRRYRMELTSILF